MYIQRPYKHTITRVTEMGGTQLVTLASYSTPGRAIAAAQKAESHIPDETREIRLRNVTYRNRYAHGRPDGWRAD